MLTTALSGFALGLLSSLHCVGMCGPLLLALPSRQGPLGPLLYHSGRITTYALGGCLFGLLGRHLYLAGWQQALSVSLGFLILLFFFLRRLPFAPVLKTSPPLTRWLTRLWQSPSTATFFLLGIGNGLLPCGMVYLAIAAALTRNTIPEATVFMLLFGAGTLPLLLTTQSLGRRITPHLRGHFRRILPLVTIGVAVLLILRGLNLGIPFLSPRLASAPQQAISCH